MKPRSIFALLLALAACQSPDTTPPTIVSSLPADGATDVALTAKLVLTFSEPVKPETLVVSPTPTVALGPAAWNDARTAVFSPPGGWQAGTGYRLDVEARDLAGNTLSGNRTITFQTVAPPDNTPPATPTGIKATAGDGEFFVEWNPNLEPDLAGYTLYVGTAADALLPTLFVEKPATLAKVTGLENGKAYFYAVDAQDTSGNRSAKSGVASVTPKDMTSPTLLSSEPANGATDLALVPFLRFTFSEPMDKNSVEIGMCVSTDPPSGASCEAPAPVNFGTPTWSGNDTQVQFTPTDQLQSGKTHVLVISAKDRGGNPLSGPNRVAFSLRATPDTTPPTVVAHATNANPQTHAGFVELSFSEAMDQQSVQAAFLNQPALACSWVWNANTARCNTTLKQLTTYTITLGTGAKDTAGNALAAPYQFSFSTPNFNPRLKSVSPRDGAFNVSVTAPITFTFTEAMDQSSVQGALEVKVGSSSISGTFSWSSDNTQMTFTPSTSYGYSKTVTWKITTAAMEQPAGRQIALHLPEEVSGSFVTQMQIAP
jgi:methionine-rich copper-binding protein CopC